MKYLAFQIASTQVAWRASQLSSSIRKTQDRPSRSHVFGFLGACLGIYRNDRERFLQIQKDFGFAVRVERVGDLGEDYQCTHQPGFNNGKMFPSKSITKGTPKTSYAHTRRDEIYLRKLNAKQSLVVKGRKYYEDKANYKAGEGNPEQYFKEYLMGHQATILIWARVDNPSMTLEELREAILKPHFSGYWGAKGCVIDSPMQPQILEAESLKGAFESSLFIETPWELDDTFKISFDKHPNPGYEVQLVSTARDVLNSLTKRIFDTRNEYKVEEVRNV